jgi:hypothetical protein
MLKRFITGFLLLMLIPVFTGCTDDKMDTILIAELLEDGVISENIDANNYTAYKDDTYVYLMCKIQNSVSDNEYVCVMYNTSIDNDDVTYVVQGFTAVWDGVLLTNNVPAIEHNILNSEFNAEYQYVDGLFIKL